MSRASENPFLTEYGDLTNRRFQRGAGHFGNLFARQIQGDSYTVLRRLAMMAGEIEENARDVLAHRARRQLGPFPLRPLGEEGELPSDGLSGTRLPLEDLENRCTIDEAGHPFLEHLRGRRVGISSEEIFEPEKGAGNMNAENVRLAASGITGGFDAPGSQTMNARRRRPFAEDRLALLIRVGGLASLEKSQMTVVESAECADESAATFPTS